MNNIKVFVDLPNFSEFSNGTRCLRDLIKDLESQELNVLKIRRNYSIYMRICQKLSFNFFNKQAIKFKNNANRGDWLLACDTTPNYLLKFARKKSMKIIWWQLAPYCLLGGNQFPEVGDYSIPFSSFSDPEAEKYFYYQPEIDIDWRKYLEELSKKKIKKSFKICIYTGKGRLCALDKKIKDLFPNYTIEIITRLRPSVRSEFFDLLVNCDGLISFDELSQTNLEAASLGIPVYFPNPLFKDKCIKKFNLKDFEYRFITSPEKFISIINKPYKTLKTLDINYLTSPNKNTLENLIKIINGELSIEPLNKTDIKRYKSYTKSLKEKKIIYPYINSGQAPSSLFINKYKEKLLLKDDDLYFNYFLKLFDYFGDILYKLKIIRIVEKTFNLCEFIYLKFKRST